MTRKMIINAINEEEVRIAVLQNARLEDFDIETRTTEKNKGNIYKARVVDVEPSLNAAFIDYGADKQGFLTAGDVDPKVAHKSLYEKLPDDLKNGGRVRGKSAKQINITDLLKPKQEILVQVTKEEVGAKGAVLTTYLSLAGRYLVLTPDSGSQGVSRKIDDEDARQAMYDAVRNLDVPEGMGTILRTAGRDRSQIDLARDLKVLTNLWKNIRDEARKSKAPALIFKEQDVIIRALRDYYTSEIDEVILDSDEAYDRAAEYMHMVMPKQRSVLSRYVERRPIFHHYQVEEQLEGLMVPRVELPSGGSIVIEPTEALVSIDVNSGKQKTGDHEQTALQTNLEAAVEVARQLRLRDLGGIVVVDFIDMTSRRNQAKVERALGVAVKHDKARIKLGRISRNGTLELTRQRLRASLAASVFRSCPACSGTGRILNPLSHCAAILRRIEDRASRGDLAAVSVQVEPEAANLLRTEKWSTLQEMESRLGIRIDVVVERGFSPGQADFTFETDPNKKPIELPEPNFGPAFIPEELRAEMEAMEEEERREEEALRLKQKEEKRSNKRKRGEKGKKSKGGGDGDAFDMPTFELVDPKKLGLGDGAKSNGKKRRRKRGGKGRGEGADRIEKATLRPPKKHGGKGPKSKHEGRGRSKAPAPAPKKRGFFSWLFGRKD